MVQSNIKRGLKKIEWIAVLQYELLQIPCRKTTTEIGSGGRHT